MIKSLKLLFHTLLILTFSLVLPRDAFSIEVQVRVSSDNDDAEERISNGDMSRGSSDLELGHDGNNAQIVGMRFRSINIPQGATINSAYIEFEVDETDSGTTNLTIYGQDADTARQFANNDDNISDRTGTAARVNWSPAAWAARDEKKQTPDIKTIIQEIVDRPGWAANNDMAIMIEPGSGCNASACQRTAESRDGEPGAAPLLVIDYGVSVGTTLTGNLNVDNSFRAYISTDDNVQGTLFGTGNDWSTTEQITTNLQEGQDYYLHIYAEDSGFVAGFLGEFTLSSNTHIFENDTTTLLTNGTDWRVSGGGVGWSNYIAVTTHGTNSDGPWPWGTVAGVDGDAQWIWSTDIFFHDYNYFTTKISAASPSYTVSSVHGACGVDNLLIVEFDNAIDSDALDTAYYSLSAGTVSSVSQQDDTTVVLQVVGITAGQAYTLTVEGLDYAIDFTGLTGHYFDQRNASNTKVAKPAGLFSGNEYLRKDLQLDFDWQRTRPDIFPDVSGNDERFSVRWNGYVVPDQTGSYEFRFRSDDGMRLDFDGVEIVADWSDHSPRYSSSSAAQALNAGQGYPIEVEYYEHTGQAVAELEWRRDGGSWEVIPAVSLNSCAVTDVLPDPVAEYRMDEETWPGTPGDVVDSSVNANNGDAQNGLNTTGTAHLCRAGDFDGVDDYIESAAVGSTLTGTSSMSFWLRTTQVGNNTGWRAPGIAGIEESGGSDDIFWGWIDASGRIGLSVGNDYSTKSTTVINDNTFHHVVLTRDAVTGAYKIYIDGTLDQSGTLATGIIGNSFSSIGRIEDTGGSPEYFQGQLDEVKIYDSVLNDAQVTALYTETRSCGALTPLAHFAFEQSDWSGAGVSIDDYSGNGNAGISTGNASSHVDGKVCKGTFIPNNSDSATIDAINSQLDLDTDVGDQGTILLWYRAETNWVGSGDRMLIDATTDIIGNANDKYFYLAKLNDGRLRFSLEDSSDADFDVYSSGNSVAAGTWVHLGVSWDFSADQIQIFKDGSAIASTAISSNGSVGDLGNIYFGDNSSSYISPGNSAYGRLDEIKIYNSVLSESDVATAMVDTHPCVSPPSVDHYEITHDGSGLTCDSESVTINACANNDCSTLSTEAVTLDFQGNATTISSHTFTGSTTFNFNYTTAETLSLSLANESIAPTNALECINTAGGTSCDMSFADAGFRFLYGASNSTIIANQIAGNSFAEDLKLQAVENVNGVCTGLFSGNVTVELAQQSNAPGDMSTLDFLLDGSAIAKNASATVASYSSRTLNFGADSIATLTNPIYQDAGQISLHARYQSAGVNLSGSSNQFWVRPDKFVLSAQSGGSDINGSTADSGTKHKAGAAFVLTVTAVNSSGVTTPNYQPGQIQLSLERTGPTAGGADGSLTYANSVSVASSLTPAFADAASLTAFTNGVSSYSSASYSEVGLLNLDIQDVNYGGQGAGFTIPGDEIAIGRFTPNHLTVSLFNNGAFAEACNNSFTYLGQNFTYDAASLPSVLVTARNLGGTPTQNYTEPGYQKLEASFASSSFTRSFSDQDNTNNGNDGATRLNAIWNADATPGALSLTGDPGEVLFTFNSADSFNYVKDANSEVANFFADLSIDVTDVTDSDGVNTNGVVSVGSPVTLSPVGINIRYGRWKMENAYGPETQALSVKAYPEYLSNDGYVVNTDDVCTNVVPTVSPVGTGATDLIDIPVGTESTTLTVNSPLDNDQGENFVLSAPGPGGTGTIDISQDLSAVPWLRYDWDGDGALDAQHPAIEAQFGQYRGHDRIIYWREVSN